MPAPLPPLPAVSGPELSLGPAAIPHAPAWSPLAVTVPLFAAIWVCFAVLAGAIDVPPAAEVAGLAGVLRSGAAIVALVLVTLSVAHVQISGLRPRPAVLAVVVLGLAQGAVAARLGSAAGPDFWGAASWMFVLAGVAVPLAWVGGQFQYGVRRQRVEQDASLVASWMEQVRRQAHQTVDSVHRHDVRSMLFVIDGAARTLTDGNLSSEQRASFGEMLHDGVERLGALMDVRTEEIQPFAVETVARAVSHAERKAGRRVTVELPSEMTAVGRAADVTAVLRTLIAVAQRRNDGPIQLRGEVEDEVAVVRVEPAGADPQPLLRGNWEEISAESFKASLKRDENGIDLFVAARLLAEQGADVWSAVAGKQFAVRLPTGSDLLP